MSSRILIGDCIDRLRELPADSVHCVVTSPPYWGLRDYGTGTWEGGDPGCDHMMPMGQRQDVGRCGVDGFHGSQIDSGLKARPYRDTCAKCGARRIDQQIGLEPTPEAWAARLVEVFREVRRVLRPEGVCFVNIGDSYAQNSGRRTEADAKADLQRELARGPRAHANARYPSRRAGQDRCANSAVGSLKPKDLIGQPWLLAFALRADGWWLRSEIIWAKPNPMPESVRDRPTKAHEQVFLLTKSERYFYDAEAVRERADEETRRAASFRDGGVYTNNRSSDNGADKSKLTHGDGAPANGRNARSVWTIATEPFPEAHFATFPTELARRCILAGTSAKGCCPACGAPWARVVERRFEPQGDVSAELGVRGHNGQKPMVDGSGWQGFPRGSTAGETLGWRPTCACDAGDPAPCQVLDPFGGSGTTGLVAEQLGRDAILIELSPAYAEMAERRLARARGKRYLGAGAKHIAPLAGQASLF